ncbi:hypothetical protein [Thermococcus sp.]|uniref:hypothetical protein n=1 Tax=Thermococcus sp. TaxID=35749 RepID=UPI0025DCBD4D|nr:hypothetical protein [Thermococcus sp.]
MTIAKNLFLGLFLFLISSLIMTEVRGPESGLYVLAINIMFVPLWGTIVLWSKHTENGFKLRLTILTSLLLFLGLLGAIAGVYHDPEKALGIMVVFLMLSLMFILPLYWAKRKKERGGKHLTYSTREVRYFWAYQWIAVGVLVIKSNEPMKTLLSLLPGLAGGYFVILGLIELKMENLGANKGGI